MTINEIISEQKFDTRNGQSYEILTFANRFQEAMYTSDLMEIGWICDLYGLNINLHSDFIKAKNIYKT